jgi:ferrous-iron efflux pump FieF
MGSNHSHSHHNNHSQQNSRAIILSVSLSVILVILKAYAWNETGSVSVLTSLLDSGMDVLISALNLVAVIYAAKPADDEHSFGHSSIEDIVGLVQASFIGAAGLLVIYESISHFITPQPVQESALGISIISISILFALIIVVYQTIISRRTGSVVLKAELLHYGSDLLLNAAVILSLLIASSSEYAFFDPLMGLAIAAYILYGSWQIGARAFNNLMDRELEDDTRESLQEIIHTHEGIKGFHDFKTRRSGSRIFVQCHIEIDSSISFLQAHKITDSLEDKLLARLPEAEIILHQDPVKQV